MHRRRSGWLCGSFWALSARFWDPHSGRRRAERARSILAAGRGLRSKITGRRTLTGCTLVLVALPLIGGTTGVQGNDEKSKRPSLSLKITPPIAMVPARVRAVVEVRGGDDGYEEFYCPTVEWEWGDETISEATLDCEPYQAGRSTIRRRFTGDHTYQVPGSFKVTFRLKQKKKVVASTSANIQIRSGLNDPF